MQFVEQSFYLQKTFIVKVQFCFVEIMKSKMHLDFKTVYSKTKKTKLR